jgi:hypothetical protein
MRVAKCLAFDGATELCLVRLENGEYAIGDGPVVDMKVRILGESDSNYTTTRLRYEREIETQRKVRL